MKLFQNSRKQFENLTWSLSTELYRFAFWRLANAHDAEDVVQETYLRAYRSFNTFQSGTNIKAWMMRILINVVNDRLRKRIMLSQELSNDNDLDELSSVADESALGQDPEARSIEQEIDPSLMNALRRLPSGLLQPLLLREVEEMTYSEIAAILQIPTGTVMSRLFRARRQLRNQLTAELSDCVRNLKIEGGADGMR